MMIMTMMIITMMFMLIMIMMMMIMIMIMMIGSYYPTEEEAAEAFDRNALQFRGHAAILNFSRDNYLDEQREPVSTHAPSASSAGYRGYQKQQQQQQRPHHHHHHHHHNHHHHHHHLHQPPSSSSSPHYPS
jgi:hypothetical protein